MDTIETLLTRQDMGTAYAEGLSRESLKQLTPAAYAEAPHEKLSSRYAFLPTSAVIDTMDRAGFTVVEARQSKSRKRLPAYAPHALRFRQRCTEVYVGEVVPEILVLNSHDGSSAYHVRVALYRAICTNGMIVSDTALPAWKVAHRGSAAAEVLEAAMDLVGRFKEVGTLIERMRGTFLTEERRLRFASDALRLRYPDEPPGMAVAPADLLKPGRVEDEGLDVWHTMNVIQEHIIRGGVKRRTASNRIVQMRGVRAIREDVRLNVGLWDRAMHEIA
ncbi:hypothetical protein GCM10011487_44890 [Steroidobacter agaridevorans]|uniref:DUF945 domain-containing protein n=1 Tax=Steroidobacter agaridevorans TaxID=2695856 RepID=A0A829YGX1_9GAMM|nr:DUF932 domain-containing protein [Steroidobacter agaridevorans]GFE82489.1 hypothetical protein GCM10011487_44890 [Steroidobacter agaridevorans]